MNFEDLKKATRLMAQHGELHRQLKWLAEASGFPGGRLSYSTDDFGSNITVSISAEMQPSIETLVHALLISQISLVERDLAALGVNTGKQNA